MAGSGAGSADASTGTGASARAGAAAAFPLALVLAVSSFAVTLARVRAKSRAGAAPGEIATQRPVATTAAAAPSPRPPPPQTKPSPLTEAAIRSFVSALPQEFVLSGLKSATLELRKDEMGRRRVVRFVGNQDCTFVLPPEISPLVKVFVEQCERCRFVVRCNILTQHIEVSRCRDVELDVDSPLQTIQVDLSDSVAILCDLDCCKKVYHAGVSNLRVCHEGTGCVAHDFLTIPSDAPLDATRVPLEEQQYVTEMVGGALRTDKVHLEGLVPVKDVVMASAS
jgi:hypothetical protein